MSLNVLFANSLFNTNGFVPEAIVFDDNGIIDPGTVGSTFGSIYNTTYANDYVSAAINGFGYGSVIPEVALSFPNATWHVGVRYTPDFNTPSVFFDDHGIRGTTGSDVIADLYGDNVVNARGGDDLVFLGNGADRVKAGGGNDVVITLGGNDLVDLGGGADQAYLGGGDDLARGKGGRDEMFGEAGNDSLWGENGRDTLDGGADQDVLDGGNGKDVLIGGTGNDTLTGGAAADIFEFRAGDGEDVITDFVAGEDTIRLDTALAVDFAAVQQSAQKIGADLVLRLGQADVVIENTVLTDLTMNDFDFI